MVLKFSKTNDLALNHQLTLRSWPFKRAKIFKALVFQKINLKRTWCLKWIGKINFLFLWNLRSPMDYHVHGWICQDI